MAINDSLCTQCSKLGSWRYGKIHGVDKVLLQFKKSLFVLFNPTAESVNCSLFLKNLEKLFCDLTYKQKSCAKHIENLPHHLSGKFIGDNLSITDIALKN